MAYCRKCGKLLPDSANHCTVCGAPVGNQPEKFDTGRIPKPQEIAQAQEEIRVGHRSLPQEEVRVGHRAQPQEEIRVGHPAQQQRPPQNISYGAAPQPLRPLQPIQQPLRQQEPPKPKKNGSLIALYIILGVLILALLGAGAWFLWGEDLFDGKEVPEEEMPTEEVIETTPSTTAPKLQDRSWWAGDWYGWWTVLEGEGDMYLMEGAGWDVCARIEVTDDTAKLHIWDEHPGEEQNVWFVDAAISEGPDDRGILEATGGTFRDAQLAPGDLSCDPAALPYGNYQDLICITGVYTDPEDPANTCTYCIFLRPWGSEWEDLRAVDPAMPYPDMLPLHYNDWYLPLIREGGRMPEAFDL